MATSKADDKTAVDPLPESTSSQHFHFRSRHLHKLIHPLTGKIFHVVHSPHEIESKRQALLAEQDKAADFDVVLHGSDEHVSTVRDIYQHHQTQKDQLLQNNNDLLARYEHVRGELEALSKELHLITSHTVALEASFDKFGYSAHLRTRDDNEEESSTLAERPDDDGSSHMSKHEDRSLTAIQFIKRPAIRQYLHKGLLWRSPNAGEVASFELFIDLVYVGVIDTIGEAAVEHASAASFLHYVVVFAMSWKVWSDLIMGINWFEIRDIFGRITTLWCIVLLYAFTTNIMYFFDSTFTAGAAFFIAARSSTAAWFLMVAIFTPMVRPSLLYQVAVALIAACLWIGAIYVDFPGKYGLVFAALFFDLVCATAILPILVLGFPNVKSVRRLVNYVPGVNIEHRVERTGAFTSLVFGYSVITIIFQSRAGEPVNAFLGKGILALIQAFIFNWIYFEIDAWQIHVHAIRRSWITSFIWVTAHLPLSAAYILAASTLSRLVVAHDCANAEIEWLGEAYEPRAEAEVSHTLRWFYCGGLGIALLSTCLIAFSHVHKRLPNPRIHKRPRLAYRLAVAITIICLPPATHLTSLTLIATTASLTASVLILDLFGNSCAGDKFWTGGFCRVAKKRTTYQAECKLSRQRRGQVTELVGRGKKVALDDLVGGSGGDSTVELGGKKRLDEATVVVSAL